LKPVLDAKDLSVDIEVPAGTLHALQHIDFSVKQGETLCLVGESGCGKTISALAVMGLLPRKAKFQARVLLLEDLNLLTISEKAFAKVRGNRVGMIFQDPMTSLNPVYTVGNQMEEVYIRHGKGNRRQARERALYLLEKVGITAAASRLGQYPHQLSGGLRQRVMIAMTLMCEPRLIIADEPTTALDVTTQAQILHLLADLQQEFDTALLLITHDLGIVARMADQLVVMYAGQVVETGGRHKVFSSPAHPYTKALLECIPVPRRTPRGSSLGSIPGIVPSLIGEQKGCLFRNRCPHARNVCTDSENELTDLGSGHAVRCVMNRTKPSRKKNGGVQ
jgi:peptide/nickel transport system ATP-binding protein